MARHCKTFSLLWAALAGLLVAAPPHTARAYEEQVSLDLAIGYTRLADAAQLPESALAADLGAGFGVSDLGVLRASLGYAALLEHGRIAHAGRVRVEALYLLDVLQVVPFFGVGGSLTIAQGRGPSVSGLPGGHVAFGLDYLLSRSWIIGVDARTGFLSETTGFVSVSEVALRVSRLFETF
jgi:hypothetical protein